MTERNMSITNMIVAIESRYSEEKRLFDKAHLWAYFVLRRIAYYPTWLCLKAGLSANQVTVGSLIASIVGCGFLAFGSYWSVITGAALVNLWALLDHVDGNVARYNNSASNYGEFLETLTWAILGALLFISVGIGVYRHPDSVLGAIIQRFFSIHIDRGLFLFLGSWASLFYILHEFIYRAFERIFAPIQQSLVSKFKAATMDSILYKLEANIDDIIGFILPVLLVCAVLQALSVFLLAWAIIPTGAFIAVTIQILRRIKTENG